MSRVPRAFANRSWPPDDDARDAGFRAIFVHALDPMLVADNDARYVDANPAACEWLGLSIEELRALRRQLAQHPAANRTDNGNSGP